MSPKEATRNLLNLAGFLGFATVAIGLFMLSVPWALVVLGSLIVTAAIIGAYRL